MPLPLILVIVVALAAYATHYFTGPGDQLGGLDIANSTGSRPAPIVGIASVVDGDTIEIHGQRVRFNGIDAPESRQYCTYASGHQYPCGRQAAEALANFLAASRPVQCTFVSWDRYRRFVGDCRRADGVSVASWMVEHGRALDWPRYSHGAYAQQQTNAETARVGIWIGTFDKPWDWREQHSEATNPTKSPLGLISRRQVAQSYSCQPRRFCTQISTCEEARWYLANCSWGSKLDRDSDGIPCEGVC
ncbi:thermonuclease family protein [Mesorhizobium sp. M0205]|uniref:thermonuclease family protein n=1 Tax=Mesorhizobium sp. M0205 TaxID=2956914 RepID=UPI00333DAA99